MTNHDHDDDDAVVVAKELPMFASDPVVMEPVVLEHPVGTRGNELTDIIRATEPAPTIHAVEPPPFNLATMDDIRATATMRYWVWPDGTLSSGTVDHTDNGATELDEPSWRTLHDHTTTTAETAWHASIERHNRIAEQVREAHLQELVAAAVAAAIAKQPVEQQCPYVYRNGNRCALPQGHLAHHRVIYPPKKPAKPRKPPAKPRTAPKKDAPVATHPAP